MFAIRACKNINDITPITIPSMTFWFSSILFSCTIYSILIFTLLSLTVIILIFKDFKIAEIYSAPENLISSLFKTTLLTNHNFFWLIALLYQVYSKLNHYFWFFKNNIHPLFLIVQIYHKEETMSILFSKFKYYCSVNSHFWCYNLREVIITVINNMNFALPNDIRKDLESGIYKQFGSIIRNNLAV